MQAFLALTHCRVSIDDTIGLESSDDGSRHTAAFDRLTADQLKLSSSSSRPNLMPSMPPPLSDSSVRTLVELIGATHEELISPSKDARSAIGRVHTLFAPSLS